MPSPTSFKRQFNVTKGTIIGTFLITNVKCGHVVKKPYERYEFPMEITFKESSILDNTPMNVLNVEKLHDIGQECVKVLSSHVNASRIIYSEFGSPYECHFGNPRLDSTTSDGNILVKSCGVGIRRRDIPTMNEEKKIGNEELMNELKAAAPKLFSTLRIISSRFNTSTCASCGELISAGEKIAQPKSKSGKWHHVKCILGSAVGKNKRKFNVVHSMVTRSKKRRK